MIEKKIHYQFISKSKAFPLRVSFLNQIIKSITAQLWVEEAAIHHVSLCIAQWNKLSGAAILVRVDYKK